MENRNNDIYQLIAHNLKIQRKKKGWTQEKFARLCNYNYGFIKNIESKNKQQTFSIYTLQRFAEVLDIDIREFFRPIEEENTIER